jgi:hypothetical protein
VYDCGFVRTRNIRALVALYGSGNSVDQAGVCTAVEGLGVWRAVVVHSTGPVPVVVVGVHDRWEWHVYVSLPRICTLYPRPQPPSPSAVTTTAVTTSTTTTIYHDHYGTSSNNCERRSVCAVSRGFFSLLDHTLTSSFTFAHRPRSMSAVKTLGRSRGDTNEPLGVGVGVGVGVGASVTF